MRSLFFPWGNSRFCWETLSSSQQQTDWYLSLSFLSWLKFITMNTNQSCLENIPGVEQFFCFLYSWVRIHGECLNLGTLWIPNYFLHHDVWKYIAKDNILLNSHYKLVRNLPFAFLMPEDRREAKIIYNNVLLYLDNYFRQIFYVNG